MLGKYKIIIDTYLYLYIIIINISSVTYISYIPIYLLTALVFIHYKSDFNKIC